MDLQRLHDWVNSRPDRIGGSLVADPTTPVFHAHVGPGGALFLRGELDMATVQDLQDGIDEVIVPGRAIVFDMARLTFLGSSGITCIIRTCRATGHPVVLRNAPPRVRRVLDLVDPPPQRLAAWVFEGERGDPHLR